MAKQLEGVELVRAVIELVKAKGFVQVFGEANVDEIEPKPVPLEVLDRLTLDGGIPLSPCLREWLAFDSTFFEWFDAGSKQRECKLPELLADWGADRALGCVPLSRTVITRNCYWLPLGDETMRFVYPSTPDALGELPVMLIDVDGMPQIEVGYPGIDMYLGNHARILEDKWWKRPSVVERLRHHQKHVLRGLETIEYGDELFPAMDDGEIEGFMDEEN